MDSTPWQHDHVFDRGNPLGEKNTRRVVAINIVMMVVEIVAGIADNSMALLADGLHMGTHIVAFGITLGAYWLARRHANDPRYAFGTWKMEVLGGFASAIALIGVALWMTVESIQRLFVPENEIKFGQALMVAIIGLAVNLASALLLKGHSHAGHTDCDHAHAHDLNLRAAYLHVLADALTSVLAIGALFGGQMWGWNWLDPATGIVGAVVVGTWSLTLIRDTTRILLDREMDHDLVDAIRGTLQADGHTRVVDLHVWRVGRNSFSVVVSLISPEPQRLADYRALLAKLPEIAHVTIEIDRVGGDAAVK